MDTAGFEDEDPASLPGRMRAQTEAAVREADVALVPDRRARGADRRSTRKSGAGCGRRIRRWWSPPTRPRGAAARPGGWRPTSSGWASRSLCRPSMARGWSICSRRCARTSSARSLPSTEDEDAEGGPMKLAIVGRPNAGKSTLVNKMLGEERMITGPEAGITARFDQHRMAVAMTAEACRADRYRGPAGSAPRSRTSSRNCR